MNQKEIDELLKPLDRVLWGGVIVSLLCSVALVAHRLGWL